jgi:AraC-like DNA-binding protein
MIFDVATGVTLEVHECLKPKGDWTPATPLDFHGLVLVRRGGFRVRLDDQDAFVGPSMAFFEGPGKELQIRHPNDDGDLTTMFRFSELAAQRLTGATEFPTRPVTTQGWIDFAHRRLVAALSQGSDQFEAEEQLAWLVGVLIESVAPGRMTTKRSSTRAGHQRMVDTVREAISSNPASMDLPSVAALTGHSMFHVSRTFSRYTGQSLARFRNSVRAAIALERLEQGERDLAGLALHLGFTDQPHMTRVLRSEVGLSPARIRTALHATNGQIVTSN